MQDRCGAHISAGGPRAAWRAPGMAQTVFFVAMRMRPCVARPTPPPMMMPSMMATWGTVVSDSR